MWNMNITIWSMNIDTKYEHHNMEYEHYDTKYEHYMNEVTEMQIVFSRYLSSNPTFSILSELRDSSARLIKLGGVPSFIFIISGEYEFLSC